MAKISQSKLFKIKQLYQSGYSARAISEKYGVSLDAVYYFFRKNQIPRRNPRENNALQFQNKPLSFKIKQKLSSKEELLKIAGIMLYWAEGSNWQGEVIVDFANSKPEMIKLFLAFLRTICGIREDKLRSYLYCYSNQKPESLVSFWSEITKIPIKQFTKPYIRAIYNSNKITKMKYGLLHIRYNDKKLLILIKDWIFQFSKQY